MDSPTEVFDYLKHPVHAFKLTKRMTVDLGVLEGQVHNLRQFGESNGGPHYRF